MILLLGLYLYDVQLFTIFTYPYIHAHTTHDMLHISTRDQSNDAIAIIAVINQSAEPLNVRVDTSDLL